MSASARELVGWHRGPEETGTGAAEEFLGGGNGGTHLTIHQSGFLTDNCTKDRGVERLTIPTYSSTELVIHAGLACHVLSHPLVT